MAHIKLLVALGVIAAASPLSAQPDSGPIDATEEAPLTTAAPPGGPDTKYCMRIELTGNIMDPVRCWTRDEWAEQGVDVDRDWPEEGVRVIEA